MTRPNNWPKGWRSVKGRSGIYYKVPARVRHLWDNRQTFKLGDNEAEAFRTWFARTGGADDLDQITVEYMLDVFMSDYVAQHLSDETYHTYKYHVQPLKRVFGHQHPDEIEPVHVYRYLDHRPRVAGNREASVLSSALTFAVEKGWIKYNLIRGNINRRGARAEKPRTRVPTLEELERFCDINPHLRGYVTLKRITGLRQGQMLKINLTEHWDGKTLTPPASKGGKDTRYSGPPLESAISLILDGRLPVGPLFVNRNGSQETATGFRSKWRRAMARFVLDQGGDNSRFNEHDIRKYTATEAETLEHAQRLLGHQSPKVTAAVYRQGPEDVEVLK